MYLLDDKNVSVCTCENWMLQKFSLIRVFKVFAGWTVYAMTADCAIEKKECGERGKEKDY